MFKVGPDSKPIESAIVHNIETEVDTMQIKSEEEHETDSDLKIIATSRSIFGIRVQYRSLFVIESS